jgi:hypothetical protein
MNDDLFHLPRVLGWLPDELLFSLASRQHRLAGHVNARVTCQQLFGHSLRGSAHDFPSRIDQLVARFDGYLGDADTVIRDHTVLPFYLPLRSAGQAANALSAMRGDGIGGLKYSLGLLTSRFRAHHPLKACLACMEADRRDWHVAYWHRRHQVPGVWVCNVHDAPMLEATVKSTGVGRFLWHLPSEDQLLAPEMSQANKVALGELADISLAMMSLPKGFHFSTSQLAVTYKAQLQLHGLASAAGRLHMAEITQSYVDHVQLLRCVPELAVLPRTAAQAVPQIQRLLSGLRGRTHPLRHVVMIHWLFGSFDVLLQSYRSIALESEHSAKVPAQAAKTKKPNGAGCAAQILSALTGGESVTSVARRLGVDPTTVMACAATAGFASPRRPKLLKASLRGELIHALEDGQDKCQVAIKLGLSVSTVTRILRTEVGLHAAWTNARFQAAQGHARDTWREIIEANPASGIKALRLLESAVYAWLYRNDRAWLTEQCKLLAGRSTMVRPSSICWDERDRDLATAVQKIVALLGKQHPGQTIALWQIYQRLPELKAKLAKLDRMPLTYQVLRQSVGRRSKIEAT